VIASSGLKNAWEVLVLFLIPVGGGIPAGVLLAKTRGLNWAIMIILYFISDVILACIFEPLMLLFIKGTRHSPFMARLKEAFKKTNEKMTAHYGTNLGPLALIGISFAVDPMTGRSMAKAVGHGFVKGWAIAITGDMFYFAILMIGTLWFKSILGDTNRTIALMLVLMFAVPVIIRRIKERRKKPS
jgi:hypothetical protein